MNYKELRSKIDRPYHAADISLLLKREVSKSECYTIEFQLWFIELLGRCHRHAYPFIWRKSKTCIKCRPN